MLERIAADAVMLLHLAFVIFVVLGALLVLRYPRAAVLHLPAVAWGAWIEITGSVCPLTFVENDLRRRAGEAGLPTGFIEHYIYPVLYPPGLTRSVQWTLAVIVIAGNLGLYAWILRRRRAGKVTRRSIRIPGRSDD
jgi:hypothetical protein